MPRRLLSKPEVAHVVLWATIRWLGVNRKREVRELVNLSNCSFYGIELLSSSTFAGRPHARRGWSLTDREACPYLGSAQHSAAPPWLPHTISNGRPLLSSTNYLRSTLTLRGLSSLTVSLGKQTTCQDAAPHLHGRYRGRRAHSAELCPQSRGRRSGLKADPHRVQSMTALLRAAHWVSDRLLVSAGDQGQCQV